MTRTLLCAVSLLACTPLAACAAAAPGAAAPAATARWQDGDTTPRKTGTILKHDVDGLIDRIADLTAEKGRAAPYAVTLPAAAQMLCAMGHCHRFYVGLDNPRIRATLQTLIGLRQKDGSFGDGDQVAVATAWTADALEVMDAVRYRAEIDTARQWLQQHGAATSLWEATVQGVLAKVRPGQWPEDLARPEQKAAAAAASWTEAAEGVRAIPTLVRLVACQAANRALDQGKTAPAAAAFSPAQQKAFDFLLAQQQDGVFMASYGGKTFPDPAFTGFGLLSLQTKPAALRSEAETKVIEQGLRWLLDHQNEDGSFGQQVQNYTTSVVVGALSRWGDAAAKPALQKAQKYLLACQNVESSGYSSSDRDYGSIGYGGSQRGDLSNVNFALQALRQSGLPAEHEAFRKALVFLQRTQNLKTVNDFAGKVSDPDAEGKLIDVESGDDGGAAYYPGNSAAGYVVTPDGKSQPRSYGSMTYALLKSYTLCGLEPGDPRVQAAVDWISRNWTLEENPGFAVPAGDKARYAGLFYYYMVLSQALDMADVKTVEAAGPAGKPQQVDWRAAMKARLETMQAQDGSWRNEKNSRWMESSDLLCTFYAMLALERCNG